MTPNSHSSIVSDYAVPPPYDRSLEEQLARILARIPPILRLPLQGDRCPYSQLCRTGLTELVTPTARNGGNPPVQAIYQRAHRYAQRRVWLIPAENLFRYLLTLGASSLKEYQKADGLRTPVSDAESHLSDESPISRNTRKERKENSSPTNQEPLPQGRKGGPVVIDTVRLRQSRYLRDSASRRNWEIKTIRREVADTEGFDDEYLQSYNGTHKKMGIRFSRES
jgi:hypothetical protein